MRINHGEGGKTPSQLNEPETPYKYHCLKDKGYSVLFSVGTKDKTVSYGFAISLAQTTKTMFDLGIPFVSVDANNSNFTDLTRNKAASLFLHSKCTHLLQIDADMEWNVCDLLDMFLYDKEFIAAVGRKKTDEIEFCALPVLDEDGDVIGQTGETEKDVLIKMSLVGGAFTLIKHSVFEKLVEKNKDLACHGVGAGQFPGYAFYQCKYTLVGHRMEDYFFCDLCTKAGINIWCYPNVTLGHQGIKDYKGNYFESHRKANQQIDIEKVVKKIEKECENGIPANCL